MGREICVLVVDDSDDHRELMERSLRDAGIRVCAVGSGAEALRSLQGVDLVLLDHRLPGMSGLETLRAIRESGGPSVVMVTGMGSEHLAVEAMRAGAIDYIVKDFYYVGSLPGRIERAWRQHDLARRASELQRLALLVTSAGDRGRIFSEIVRGARMLLDAVTCALCVVGPRGLEIAAFDGDDVGNREDLLAAAGRVLAAGEVAERGPHRLLVRLPSLEDEPLGVLALIGDGDREHPSDDVRLAEAFSSFAGLALQNLRRYELEAALVTELSARAGQQAAVARLGQRALTGTAPAVLMQEASALLTEVLAVDRVHVLEYVPVSEALLVRASAGRGDGLVGQRLIAVASDPQVGSTLATGQPVIIEDVEAGNDFPIPATPGRDRITSRVTVLIPGSRSAFGVISAETLTPRVFSTNDIDFLQSVTHVLAAAIDRHRGQEELAHLALHDPLTGLPNRALCLDRLEQALSRADRHGSSVAVCFLDVDRFKVVNDGLGHTAGDDLLMALASRLMAVVRSTDTVARLGGDEFVVLFEDVTDSAQAAAYVERIAAAVAEPVSIAGRDVTVTASMGLVLADAEHDEPESLLQDADAAMYRAKERGRARYEFFDTEMRATVVQRLETEGALRRALECGQLRLVYQPEVALESGQVVGVEALLRWEHPQRGLLPPSEFLSLAEETGLIVPMGPWVLREACRQIQECRNGHPRLARLVVWVNLSSRQLTQPDLPELVVRVLAETGTAPSNLGIEITESAVMDDTEVVGVALAGLKRLGVQLAIDDFGTGFSSLSYLRRFPVGVLKVDRSFVAGLGRDAEDSAIVRAVIGLAHSLGLSAVAEGVETFEQVGALRSLGCDLAQGYYFSRPLVFADLRTMLETRATGPLDEWIVAAPPQWPQPEPLRGIRVLVCDDDPTVRRIFRTEIELSGAIVTEAADGEEAVEIGYREQPDLVLLDVFMPRRDGLSALPELASRCPKARVLMVTASATTEVVSKSKALGAAGCFDKVELIPRVVQALTDHLTPV